MMKIGGISNSRVTIVGNSWKAKRGEREALVSEIENIGVDNVRIHELPDRDLLSVYYNPQNPDELITIGNRFGTNRVETVDLSMRNNVFFDVEEAIRRHMPQALHEYLVGKQIIFDHQDMDRLFEITSSQSPLSQLWKVALRNLNQQLEEGKIIGLDNFIKNDFANAIKRDLQILQSGGNPSHNPPFIFEGTIPQRIDRSVLRY